MTDVEEKEKEERKVKKRKTNSVSATITVDDEEDKVFATCDEADVQTDYVEGTSASSVKEALKILNKKCTCEADFHYEKDKPEPDEEYVEEEEEEEVIASWWTLNLQAEDETFTDVLDRAVQLQNKMKLSAFRKRLSPDNVNRWAAAITEGLQYIQRGEPEARLRLILMEQWIDNFTSVIEPFANGLEYSSDWKLSFNVAERGLPAAPPESIPRSADVWYKQAEKVLTTMKNVYAVNIAFGDGPAGFGSCVAAADDSLLATGSKIKKMVEGCKHYKECNIALVASHCGAGSVVTVKPSCF